MQSTGCVKSRLIFHQANGCFFSISVHILDNTIFSGLHVILYRYIIIYMYYCTILAVNIILRSLELAAYCTLKKHCRTIDIKSQFSTLSLSQFDFSQEEVVVVSSWPISRAAETF